ncbi:MAG: PA14 domain-containing protein, partial [Thermoflexales bacterium]
MSRSVIALAGLVGLLWGRTGLAQALPEPRRVVLSGLPNDLVPNAGNVWACGCDTDGCWPGCFPIAAATLLRYWSAFGYPELWRGTENDVLRELRAAFPGLFCYNNRDDDGKPGESGYDAINVARGLEQYVRARGYQPAVQAIAEPTFEQIVAEIDAGRPLIGAFGVSPWGAHAVTIIGYDATAGRRSLIVRPNLRGKPDTELAWGEGYSEFAIITFAVRGAPEALAPAPPRTFELVLDDAEARTFSTTGAWLFDDAVGFAGKAHYALTAPPDAADDTAIARWEVLLPYDGMWEVYTWLPERPPPFSVCEGVSRVACEHAPATVVTYRVTHAEGMSFVHRSQSKASGWVRLGAFPFTRGGRAAIEIGNATGDAPARFVWADAVRLVWRAPLLVRSESGGPVFVVNHGVRRAVLDPQTIEALRLSLLEARALPAFTLEHYPQANVLPSVMGAWVGALYANPTLAPPISVITHSPQLDFNWAGAPPADGVPAFGFSARWTRYFATTEGDYPIAVEAVGGVRVWVNGKLEIAAWDAPADRLIRHEKTIPLSAGLHRVDVEYVALGPTARLRFGNLPPNTPLVADAGPTWTNAPTVTLRWQDTGDPDRIGSSAQPRFFVALWHESGWQAASGWITTTAWTTTLPWEGTYRWNVVASDGYLNSQPTPPSVLIVDRTPPWAQMMSAMPLTVSADLSPAGAVSWSASLTEAAAAVLLWWGSDAPHTTTTHLNYDLQARELQRTHTVYTFAAELAVVTRTGYALVISGAEEITVPVVVTDTLTFTTVVPLQVVEDITEAAWITIASGLRYTQTLFLGQPGSTYEIRVRAVDAAGNAQGWYDG